jgi:hypothetical protein
MRKKFYFGNLTGKNVYIQKYNIKDDLKKMGGMCTGIKWLRIRSSGRLL